MTPLTQILGQAKVDDLVLYGSLALVGLAAAGLVVLRLTDRKVAASGYLPERTTR